MNNDAASAMNLLNYYNEVLQKQIN